MGDTDKIEANIEKLSNRLSKLYEKRSLSIDGSQLESEITRLENEALKLSSTLKQADLGFEVGDVAPIENELVRVNTQLSIMKTRKQDIEKDGMQKVMTGVKNVNNSLKDTIKNVSRWALALIGVEAAISLVRSAMTNLASYNDQIGADLEYMRFAIAQALKPLVESLLSIIYKILTYVNMISIAWFGIDLFANASAKSFENMQKSTDKSAKNAKDIKKSLAGFDEMNIISDSSSKDSNSGSDYTAPSYDLATPEDVPVPSWLQWIIDNKDIILATLAGIAAGLLSVKLGAEALTGLGIGIAIAGVVLLIQDIIEFLKNPTWENFLNILRDIALVIAGIAIAVGAWPVAIGAAVALVVVEVIKHWEEIKETLGKVGEWFYEHIIKPIGDFFKDLWDGIKETFNNVKEWFKEKFKGAVDAIKSVFSNIGTFFSNIFDKIKSIFKNIGQKIGDVIGSSFKTAVNAVLSFAEDVINTPIKAINKLIGLVKDLTGINIGKLGTITIPKLKSGGIVNNPGKGVPIGSAIAGESGAEGVIPLTDPTAMRRLGEEIGKWITVSNNSYTYLDGRLIQRQIAKKAERVAFATNGRNS